MHKLIHESRTANSLNYMCSPQPNKTFMGLAQLSPDRNWGIVLDGRYFCAVHFYNKMMKNVLSDDEVEKEEEQLKEKMFYAAFLKGIDNTSYLKRFTSKDEMLKWYMELTVVNPNKDKSLLWVNS